MKFRVVSDLHVEFYTEPVYLQRKLSKFYPDIKDDEVLIIAGDLGVAGSGRTLHSMNKEYKAMLEYFSRHWNYIILVPGNHEYYDRCRTCSMDEVNDMIRHECEKLGIIFLNQNSIVLTTEKEKIAILGCTLWTNATEEAYKNMNDKLRAILSHKELLQIHNRQKKWLDKEITKFGEQKIPMVVVTHHLPLMELTHPKYLEEPYRITNTGYASRLNDLFEVWQKEKYPIKHWFCGHTHERTEKKLYGIPFLINPIGYPREHKETETKVELIKVKK